MCKKINIDMLNYNEYINESKNENLKTGDKVIFNPGPTMSYYSIHKGSECEVLYAYPMYLNTEREYSIKTSTGAVIIANASELTTINSNPTTDYVEKQFTNTIKSNDEIGIGNRVLVNGKDPRIEFVNRKGTVKKIGTATYLIEFDEDDSKNMRKETMLVDKDYVKSLDEPSNVKFKNGNSVICIDPTNEFYNKIGEVIRVWPEDNECMVSFRESGGVLTQIHMQPKQIKLSDQPTRKIGFVIPPSTPTSIPTKNIPASNEEEEDDDVVIGGNSNVTPFKKEDLLEFSYKDFLLSEKISTHEDLMELKNKCDAIISDPNISKMKKVFTERSLNTIDIIESYYQFLINKISKDDLPVYRTVEQIENQDLLRTKTKVRASDSKELTRKYSFDQGIIVYWKFKDAIIFKTI